MPWYTGYTFLAIVSLVIIGVILLLALIARRQEVRISSQQYRTFLYLGIALIVVGGFLSFIYPGVFKNYFYLLVIGITFFAIGLAGRLNDN